MQTSTTERYRLTRPFSHLVKARYSCRTFGRKKIEDTKILVIKNFLHQHNSAAGQSQRMEIIQKTDLKKESLFTAGTYGLVKGARTFIAGILKKERHISWENYGYAMQSALMLATDLDLNSLWIGGVFDRRSFARFLRLQTDEFIPAIIALGYADSRRTTRDRIIRWGSRGDQRKSPDRLFFDRETGVPLYSRLDPELKTIFDNVRLAPSASNKQPWRIIFEPLKGEDIGENDIIKQGQFHLYLNRNKTYGKILPQVDLQKIDMGIAMFHFEQSIRESGIRFQRTPVESALINLPENYEYVVSYTLGGSSNGDLLMGSDG